MKTKVLFILHYPPPVHGSAVVGGFIKDSKIINDTFDCRYINLGTSKSINEIGRNPLGKISRYLKILLKVLKYLIIFKPQLCYIAITVKGVGFYKDATVAFLVKLFDSKLIYHLHNKGVAIRQENVIDNLLYSLVFKNVDVILLSKYLYIDIKKYVPEERVYYCPNGIPESEIKRQKPQNISSNETIEILFFSNLIESKGVYVLLDACKILKDKKVNFHCTFVGGSGDITLQQFEYKLISTGLNSHINYLGEKFGLEKEIIFSRADILAFPTYNECFPLVLLEAMQHSLPIISTFEGGIPDIIVDGETGFLCRQKDANCFVGKLETLIYNYDLRLRMGNSARKRYEDFFTLTQFEKRFGSIILTNSIIG